MKFDAQKILPPYIALKLLISNGNYDIKAFSEVVAPFKEHHDVMSKLAEYIVMGYNLAELKKIVDKMVENKDYIVGL